MSQTLHSYRSNNGGLFTNSSLQMEVRIMPKAKKAAAKPAAKAPEKADKKKSGKK